MATPKNTGDPRRPTDPEIDFAGYDPYIVALTGGESVSTSNAASPEQTTESRKVRLVSWLREQHRA